MEKAKILGGILGVLSKAIRIYPKIDVNYERLADFTRWGCAIAEALGFTKEDFLEAYSLKIELQNEEALNASPMALALIEYCKENVTVEMDEDNEPRYICKMNPNELFNEVTRFAEQSGMKSERTFWASDASHFKWAINKVKPNLEKVGCYVMESHDGKQRWTIVDLTKLKDEPPTSKNEEESETDAFWEESITKGGEN
jgi:hypothetical protein